MKLGLSVTMLVLDHTLDCRGAGAYDTTHWSILFFEDQQTHPVKYRRDLSSRKKSMKVPKIPKIKRIRYIHLKKYANKLELS